MDLGVQCHYQKKSSSRDDVRRPFRGHEAFQRRDAGLGKVWPFVIVRSSKREWVETPGMIWHSLCQEGCGWKYATRVIEHTNSLVSSTRNESSVASAFSLVVHCPTDGPGTWHFDCQSNHRGITSTSLITRHPSKDSFALTTQPNFKQISKKRSRNDLEYKNDIMNVFAFEKWSKELFGKTL